MNAETAVQNKTILLVDDDEDYLLQTRMQLEAAGFKVVTAGGLGEADAKLAETNPDLVVADLMMEYLDAGFVLCHHVKKRNPKTPVILVTAVTSETGMEFESTTGDERSWIKADAILTKPVRAEQLRREIGRLLQG
ncbi:MAG: response regulator [Deltaproteobacteria bacterium]|nr:response regulator [Deltaproteobacteria bacterium]